MNYNLIKSADFCGTQCDIYSDDANEMFMTISQLANCLQYANRKGIEKMLERNPYLKNNEFSVTVKMSATDGKQYETRIFTEDGIYEVTMLAKTEKAKEFRAFIRQLIKSIRKGEVLVLSTAECSQAADDKAKTAEAKLINARTRMANMYLKLANVDTVSPEYKNILVAKVNGMKTDEYGSWYRDKSPYSNKEVDTFRYNDNAVEKFRSLIY